MERQQTVAHVDRLSRSLGRVLAVMAALEDDAGNPDGLNDEMRTELAQLGGDLVRDAQRSWNALKPFL